MSREEVEQELLQNADTLYEEHERQMEPETVAEGEPRGQPERKNMRFVERVVLLRTIDKRWEDHLTSMDNMRQGIGLQALAQRNPLVAYQREGYDMFQEMMAGVWSDVVHTIYRVGIVRKDEKPREREAAPVGARTGRNDPCPCGSGKKYKKCCGK